MLPIEYKSSMNKNESFTELHDAKEAFKNTDLVLLFGVM